MTGTVLIPLGRKELPKSRALPKADMVRNGPEGMTTPRGVYEGVSPEALSSLLQ